MTIPRRADVAEAARAGPQETSLAIQSSSLAVMEFWNRLANEMIQFTADRICETVKTQQQMMHCRNVAELARLRAHWWQRAADQYAAEAGRLAEIWRETLDSTVRLRTK